MVHLQSDFIKRAFRRLFLLVALLLCIAPLAAHHRDSLTVQGLEFVENRGQWNENVLFKASLHGGAIFAERGCFTFVVLSPQQLKEFYAGKFEPARAHSGILDAAAYQVRFADANPDVVVTGNDPSAHYHNYYLGKEPSHWTSQVPLYHHIFYQGLYPGIDLHLTQSDAHLKYEFVVAAGANPADIKLDYVGVQNLFVSKGNLVVSTGVAQISELRPFAYQLNDQGDKVPVRCDYKVNRRQLTFDLGDYDPTRPLVIDPVLIFASYSGSTADNWGYTATYDKDGNLYSGGNVFNVGYPTTNGVYQVDFAGGSTDIAISKFDSNGAFLHFSTYLGGSGTEVPHSLVVNENNELYVLGTTSSEDFPVTQGAFDTTFNGGSNYTLTSTVRYYSGSDIIIAKFNENGTSLLGSTYVGGSANDGLNTVATLRKNYADEARGEIIIDAQSNVYIASSTQSLDFPVTDNAFQPQYNGGGQDGCVIKFNHNLTNMIWCSYFGGTGDDASYSLVLASDNSVYVCGGTTSEDLPTSANAVQNTFAGGANDGYVAHINANGSQLLHNSYLGTNGYDQCYLVKNDRFDNPHLFGQTNASGMVWVHNADWFVPNGGQFLTKLTPTLDSVIWSTAFGTGNGGLDISPTALLVDLCNNIYMSGWGSPTTNGGLGGTSGLPVTADAFQLTTDNNDYYFICISDDASQLVYATYFGSPHAREHVDGGTSRFDNKGRIYQAVCAGCGGYDDFPTTQGAWSQQNNSTNCNIGVIKFDFNLPAVVADFTIPNTVCAPVQMLFNNTSQRISDSTSFFWDFGDGTTSALENPTHFYTQSGTYVISLVAQDAGSCNFADTVSHELVVLSNSNTMLDDAGVCNGDFVQIGIAPSGNAAITYEWSPQDGLSNPFISNPIAAPDASTTYQLFVTDGVCIDTLTQFVSVETLSVDAGDTQTVCLGHSVVLTPSVDGPGVSYTWSDNAAFTNILNTDSSNPQVEVSPTATTTYYLRVQGLYCEAIDSVVVQVSHFNLTAPDHYVVCYGDSIRISVTPDEAGSYVYSWAPVGDVLSGQETSSPWVRPMEDATFEVTVTNEYGCRSVRNIPVLIKRYDTYAEISHVQCADAHDGQIALNVSGGEAPYHYQWSNGATTPSLNDVGAGVYSVIITDNTGCKGVDTFSISQPSPLEIQLIEIRNSNCGTPCTGMIAVSAVGGSMPYVYEWLHGDVGQAAENLCAGAYTLFVSDAHQCTVSATYVVEDTSAFQVPYQITPITCSGDCDGAITLDCQFGSHQYQIDWQHDAALHTESATQLCAGNYYTHISVDNGCDYHFYLPIEERSPLSFLHLFATPPLCHGDQNAALYMVADGGTEPYQFYLNGVLSAGEVPGLSPGTYNVQAEDAHGCTVDTMVVIAETPLLVVTETHLAPPCPEKCAGMIAAVVEGGNTPYRYQWESGEITPDIHNLCAGDYSLVVTDLNGCQAELQVELSDSSRFPAPVEAWCDVDSVYAGESVTLYATDLGGDFSYQWLPDQEVDHPHAVTTGATPSKPTLFVVVVEDAYGCQKRDTVAVFVSDVICEEPYVFVPNAFTPNGDGKNDVLHVRGEVILEVQFEIFDRWGERVFVTRDLSEGWDGTFRGEPCEPGVYDYYMQVTCIGQKKYFKKGNVTLLR